MSPPCFSASFARIARLTLAIGVIGAAACAVGACGGGVAPVGGSSGSSGTSNCSSSPSGGACEDKREVLVPPTPPSPGTSTISTGRVPAVHRASAVACSVTTPPEPNISGSTNPGDCRSNAECTAGQNGRCEGSSFHGFRCTYDACYADSECSVAGSVCACGGGSQGTNNVCLVGNCRVDTDCGQTGYCSPTLGDCGNYEKAVGYYCHTKQDECTDDSDCAAKDESSPVGHCAYEKTIGHWKCSTAQCAG